MNILQNEHWSIGILPETGGALVYGRILRGGGWVDFLRPTPTADYATSAKCASYVLLPWSNRLRAAKFRFLDKEYTLQVNYKDGTAIHGVAKDYAWRVDHAEPQRLRLSFRSDEHNDVNFPFRFSGVQEFTLEGGTFSLYTSVKNEDARPMPAGFGHHPYFVRKMGADPARLEIPCPLVYELEDNLPSAGPVPLTEERLDFRQMKTLAPENYKLLIDDLFTGHTPEQPVRFAYGDTEIHLRAGALYKHIVLYAPADKPFFALEPVTNANDGFNLHAQGISAANVFVLQPGEEKAETFSLNIIQA
ncbi:MAG: aldose epimerase [Chloroflexi bacterium]|nr:aldose epimerase [Chloroflexota bacterium]